MLPRRVLASVLVTPTLARAGRKIQPPGPDRSSGASAGASGSAATAIPSGPSTAGALIIEPNAGFSPVYDLISRARSSNDPTMDELSDHTAESDLGAAG